tara:strand:+ start:18712 stop:20097 length:1386 start_codon:yes stop_codon:yes gene_type:complete
MPKTTPALSDLYQLAEQLELDQSVPVQVARERDHAIAADCAGTDDIARLQCWLASVSARRAEPVTHKDRWLSEASAAALGRVLALFFGFSSMAAFLLTSGRGLVNVFMFLLLFVLVQLLLCTVAAWVMARTVGGGAPVVLPVNPAHWLVAKALPDRRYLREAQSVLRLVFLRYGQEFGAIFTLGAVAGFFVVLALSDFTFVWGSTFQLSDSLMEQITAWIALPWSSWLPQATVSGDLIFASRFHPAVTSLSPANIEDMRGWWPFLIMAMLTYGVLPRLLLWLLSKFFYGRQMRAAFAQLPGSERVLARMKSPLVKTQGEGAGSYAQETESGPAVIDRRLLLLNWANALGPPDIAAFEEFAAVPEGNIVNAGLGSLPEELQRLGDRVAKPVEHIMVTVKSWEPPMADLADFLGNFSSVPRCTLYLVPLPHKSVSTTRLGDWQLFARGLAFPVVDVQALERAT